MRTDDFRPSSNVEDDREQSASRGGMPGGAGGLGIGTVIIIGLISWYFGIDPSVLLNGAQILSGGGSSSQTSAAPPVTAGTPSDATGRFVALVLGDTEDRWTEIFAAGGKTYHPPKLRLFSGSEPTPCAFAKSAMGPFYCPRDQRVYLDTSFFDDLQHKFGGCSDSKACKFSEAYVIAHEVGHHVQDELGILPRVMQAQQAASSQSDANALQVRVELQADCYAGVWANRAQQKHNFLDPGDVDQALQTATAIGDDRLQKEMQGYVVPDSFTHGTSAQRKRWFMNGFNAGQVSACDTLSAS
ncbi:MAG TPA: neutral zinc metallopeptidase [Xanthobacteraceae bacterium]|nr:neutral zinc metallopeptidase [Xanthobacteraceae bacterium]